MADTAALATILLPMMRAPVRASRAELEESIGAVLLRAFRDPSYTFIFLGFFSCGYQLSFITAHFPAMITEMCGPIAPDGGLAALGITTTSALGSKELTKHGAMVIRPAAIEDMADMAILSALSNVVLVG